MPLSLSGSSTLLNTVVHGISVGSWNTKPMRPSPVLRARAAHSTRPCVGSLKPAMMRSAVDLPQPDGPSSDRNSPCRTSKSRPLSASVPLGNVLPTPRNATSEGPEECVAGGIVALLFVHADLAGEFLPASHFGGMIGGKRIGVLAGRLKADGAEALRHRRLFDDIDDGLAKHLADVFRHLRRPIKSRAIRSGPRPGSPLP